MKTLNLFIFACITAFSLKAQITVNAYDLNVGDVVLQAVDNDFQTELLESGEGLHWDFSLIHGQRTDTLIPIDPLSTNHAESFPESNLAFGTNELSLFMVLNSEAFVNLGAAGAIDSLADNLDLSLIYNLPDTAIKFPIEFGNSSNTTGWGRSSTVTYEGITGKISRSTIRTQFCDAWGTLTTPINDYEVLRVQEEVITIDSVFAVVDIFGEEFLIPIDSLSQFDTTYYYNFYSNDPSINFPLVEVNYNPSNQSIIEAKWLTFIDASSNELDNKSQISIFPNPSSEFIYINTDSPIESVHIYNLKGKLIKATYQNDISISELPKAMYYIEIKTKRSKITKRFIKK